MYQKLGIRRRNVAYRLEGPVHFDEEGVVDAFEDLPLRHDLLHLVVQLYLFLAYHLHRVHLAGSFVANLKNFRKTTFSYHSFDLEATQGGWKVPIFLLCSIHVQELLRNLEGFKLVLI